MNHETTDIEELNRERIATWHALAGTVPEYPLTTGTVEKLLRAVEYAVDHRGLLFMLDSGWFPSPAKDGTRLMWTATDVVAAATALESRRVWKPFSMIHGGKMTLVEKIRQAREANGEPPFSDLAHFDVPRLLAALVDVSHDREAVQIVAEALKLKLIHCGML